MDKRIKKTFHGASETWIIITLEEALIQIAENYDDAPEMLAKLLNGDLKRIDFEYSFIQLYVDS